MAGIIGKIALPLAKAKFGEIGACLAKGRPSCLQRCASRHDWSQVSCLIAYLWKELGLWSWEFERFCPWVEGLNIL